jgi:O-acetyl-ADP-ribose deacetylase (regulator of RNase III)
MPGEGVFYSTRYVFTISLGHIVTRSTSFPPSFCARIFSQSSQEVRESERAPRLVLLSVL